MADAKALFDSACDRVLDLFKVKNLNIWRGIAYVWYPMTFPATSNMYKLNYVTDTIGWSRVQPSLLGEARGTERAAEIEPYVQHAFIITIIKNIRTF